MWLREPDVPDFDELSCRHSHVLIGWRAGDIGYLPRRPANVVKWPRDQQLVVGDVKRVQGTLVGSACM